MGFSMNCPPRYATRRRPERESFGHELAAVAKKLGQPLMPWQRYVADVGCEIDPETGGPAYREVRVTIPRQSGKAIDVNEWVLTGNRGWVHMGDLVVGDEVFHPDGHIVTVQWASPVMFGHDCFRVTTADGRSVVADANHLWTLTDKRAEKSKGPRGARARWFEPRTLTTRQILDAGLSRYPSGRRMSATGGKRYATNEYRFVLPEQHMLKSLDVELPVDAYLFGAWLGDGTSKSGCLTSHVDDVPHWCCEISRAGYVPVVRTGGGTVDTRVVGIKAPGDAANASAFTSALRRLGVLGDKHVPDVYLAAGAAQREALLQGLCDTDGSINATRGQVEFCSTNRRLADAALYLARSLGWRATLKTGRSRLNGRDYGTKYRVCFTPKRSDPACPFRLERKAARIRERDGGRGRNTLSIASIEPVGSVPVRCIKVDSPDGLFLVGRDLVPTHNTTLFLSWQVNRCVSRRWAHPQRSVFTAQTGKDARDKWIDELFPLIRNSPLKALVATSGSRLAINEGMGNESIKFKTGSIIRLLSTSASSGHSKTLHQAVMDEVWHDTDDRREQGLRPAMITIPDAQLLVCSTAGTVESYVLNRKVETGRAATLADTGRGVAYFEWSAPDNWDPDDWNSYFTFSPALCPDPPCRCAPPGEGWRHTITLDVLRSEHASMELPEFKRAYGNVMSGASDLQWQVIPKPAWVEAAWPDMPRPEPVAFAVTLSEDRQWASVCAAGPVPESGGLFGVVVVDRRPGTGWVVDRLVELVEKWKPVAVVVDRNGPANSLWTEIEERNTQASMSYGATSVPLVPISARDKAAAAGALWDGLCGSPAPDPETGVMGPDPKVVRHRDQAELNDAVAAAEKKQASNGSWVFDPMTTDPVVAGCAEALFGYRSRTPPVPDAWVLVV